MVDETRVRRGVFGNPGSSSIDALELSIGQEVEEESGLVSVAGCEVEIVGKVVVLREFQELVLEVAILEGGFQLVGIATGCGRRSGR